MFMSHRGKKIVLVKPEMKKKNKKKKQREQKIKLNKNSMILN